MFRLWFMTFFGERRGSGHHPKEELAHPKSPEHVHAELPHDEKNHVHESPWIMLAPLVILALLSIGGGWIGAHRFEGFLAPATNFSPGTVHPEAEAPAAEAGNAELLLTIASVAVAVIGFLLAWLFYYRSRDLPDKITSKIHALYVLVCDKYRVDEAYGWLFVRPVVEGSRLLLWRQVDVGTIDALVNEAADGAQDVSDRARRMQSGNIRSYAGWVALGAAAVVAYMIWVGLK
jgi:NADH-quinone oxidoreductase subunit L